MVAKLFKLLRPRINEWSLPLPPPAQQTTRGRERKSKTGPTSFSSNDFLFAGRGLMENEETDWEVTYDATVMVGGQLRGQIDTLEVSFASIEMGLSLKTEHVCRVRDP